METVRSTSSMPIRWAVTTHAQWTSSKTLNISLGEVPIQVPHDGAFEPQVIKKYPPDISSIESKVLAMYARGIGQRNIS